MIKTISILLLTVIININLTFGQAEKKYSVGINIKPNLIVPKKKIEQLNETTNDFNLSLGFVYMKDISKTNRIVSGINYSQLSFSQIDFSPLWPSDHDGNGGSNPEKSWKKDNIKSNYIGFPIEIFYSLFEQKNNLFAKLGFEYMLNISNNINSVHFVCGEERLDLNTSPEFDNNNLFKVKVGIGFEIPNENNFKLLIEPEFEYYLDKLYSDLPLYSNSIISYGLNLKVMLD